MHTVMAIMGKQTLAKRKNMSRRNDSLTGFSQSNRGLSKRVCDDARPVRWHTSRSSTFLPLPQLAGNDSAGVSILTARNIAGRKSSVMSVMTCMDAVSRVVFLASNSMFAVDRCDVTLSISFAFMLLYCIIPSHCNTVWSVTEDLRDAVRKMEEDQVSETTM